jgi:pimeloyl-ACP methyl ester carboxylesterase
MAHAYDEVITLSKGPIQVTGLLKRRWKDVIARNPLIVLIHGGGTNAAYFDNPIYSYVLQICCHQNQLTVNNRLPNDLSDLGYDVLNIHRPGHGPNPIPNTQTPFRDGFPAFVDLIAEVYKEHCDGQGGIILIGHSLGGAICLAIAAEAGEQLPLLGVSVLGIVPVEGSTLPFPDPDPEPENPRIVFKESREMMRRLLGPEEFIKQNVFNPDVLQLIFEPGESVRTCQRSSVT